jgi:NAD(P)-dependent dehydrogenase (short-subunit alcohol dehydrogenase family)
MDVAVLNAGIGERGDYMDPNTATEALERTLDVDLRAVVSGARVIVQQMVKNGKGGRIITLASAAGALQRVRNRGRMQSSKQSRALTDGACSALRCMFDSWRHLQLQVHLV